MNYNPQQEYQSRLKLRQLKFNELVEQYRNYGFVRIGLIILSVLIVINFLFQGWSFFTYSLIPLAILFLIFTAIHQKIFWQKKKTERAIKYYERCLARIEGDWAGRGNSGEEFRDVKHPYGEDIDLFGTGSLFELLCTARTRAGEINLAQWIQAPADFAEIKLRQAAIEELRMNLDLREDLALLGEDIRSGVNPETLSVWGKGKPLTNLKSLRILTAIMCVLAIVMIGLLIADFGLLPFYFYGGLAAAIGIWLRPKSNEIIRQVEPAGRDLSLLSQLLSRIEQEQFQSIKLSLLRASLETDKVAPSKQIAQLASLNSWLEVRMNQLFRPLTAPFFMVSQLAFSVEAWRVRSGPNIEKWIAAVGEIEALCALANYAYEHPEDPFAEIVEGAKIFDGIALGHPFIPENKVVRTDLKIDHELQLIVISGSNMSGKSTLLRTVGMNAVLALAGAPVRAKSLKISPLQLGASIRIQDNLRAGASLFYAEISRLRQLMDRAGDELPLLFIIDEILHGTNSHDRRIGADAVLRGLVQRGAFGLVTTHDLALTAIVEELKTKARNVHLEDHLEDGKMTFDYVLREGIVQKSNALELMRSVGLEV